MTRTDFNAFAIRFRFSDVTKSTSARQFSVDCSRKANFFAFSIPIIVASAKTDAISSAFEWWTSGGWVASQRGILYQRQQWQKCQKQNNKTAKIHVHFEKFSKFQKEEQEKFSMNLKQSCEFLFFILYKAKKL